MPTPDTAIGARPASDRTDADLTAGHAAKGALPALLVVALFLVSLPVAAGLPTSAAAASAAAPPLPQGLVALPHSYGVIPAGSVALGAAPASAPLSFNLELNIPSTGPAAAFVSAVNTVGSPTYHQYPTGQQYVAEFGPSPATVQSLLSYLGGYGLSATPVGGLGLLYTVQGSVAEVDAAFHTTMETYRAGSTTAYAPATAPSLPDALAPWVLSIHNLNGLDLPKPTYLLGSQAPATALSADNLEGAYAAAPLISSGIAGSYTIGLAEICDSTEASTNYQTDVNSYDTANSLPAITLTLSGSGDSTCSPGSTGWALETNLDIQSSHSIAPAAPINVCLDSSDPSVCDSSFISSGNIFLGSNSWTGPGPYTSIWQTAAAAGVTLLAAAGDACAAVNDPALEPDGIGVGGTSLTVSGNTWSSEVVWSCSSSSGTGGGCDSSVAPPSYQVGMTGFPDSACGTVSERGVPDVGADADPNTGIMVYDPNAVTDGCSADPCQVGGTSLATPLWTASIDLIDQDSGFTGFFGPEVYAVAKSACYSTCYHDITSGSNGYPATVGWDPDTGVGSPDIQQIAANIFSPLGATLTPLTATIEAGTSVTMTCTVTGGHPGFTYAWMQNGTPMSGAPNAAVFSWTPTHSAPSPYKISVKVTDSIGNTTLAGPVSITVTPGPSVTLSATPTTADGGMIISETAVATGGSGGYSFNWSVNGTAVVTGTSTTNTWQAPNHTANYKLGVQVQDSKGAKATATQVVNVYSAPSLVLDVQPLGPIDVGSTVTLVANGTPGAPPSTFTFLSNGTTPLPGGAGPSNTLTWNPTGGAFYLLSVQVSDGAGKTAVSAQVPFQVNGNPVASIALPNPAIVDAGQYVSVDARVLGGTGPYTYFWRVNGLSNADQGGTYDFRPHQAGTYTFQVVINDTFGRSSTSTVASLQVNPDPTVTLSGPGSVMEGQVGTFNVAVTGGTSPYTYLWAVNGTTVGADNNDSFGFSEPAPGHFIIQAVVIDAVGYQVIVYRNINVSGTGALEIIPGTSPLESYVLIAAPLIAVAVAALIVSRRRRKQRLSQPPASPPMGPPPPGPAQGMLGPNVPMAMSPPAAPQMPPALPPGQVPPPPAP